MKLNSKILVMTGFALLAIFSLVMASNLPVSREATMIESVSPTEIAVQATGIGHWEKGMSKKKDKDNFMLDKALLDGRKAAVYFILYLGTDPLLSNDDEKVKFTNYQEAFFAEANISKYISWEGSVEGIKRTKREIKKNREYELKIVNNYKVNKELIRKQLVDYGVLEDRVDITETLGMPFIMVIPAVKNGVDPVNVLQNNSDLSHAAKVIEGYLTQRKYDVQVPEQSVALNELVSAQHSVDDVEEDYSYQLALSIGSDIYITYEVSMEDGPHGTRKAVVSCRAYETTTSRLLGTETGYSPTTKVADKVLIENAINDAIENVLNRIMNYWKEDLGKGIQYKVIVSISTDFSEDDAEEVSFVFSDVIKEITKRGRFKENIVTNQTLDYLIWCDPEEYAQSNNLYRNIKKLFADEFEGGSVKKVNLNRKLVLLKVEAE